MNDHTDNSDQFVDPVQQAAEALLYSSPDDAAVALRRAIHTEADRMATARAHNDRIAREVASSQEVAQRFSEENPEWAKDPMIRDAVKAGMRVEQLSDLIEAGIDIGKWSESLGGRIPNETEIFNAHRDLRSIGNPQMRSPTQLFEDVAGQVENKFGLRRRLRSEEASRKRAIQDRMKVSANSHGVDLDGYATNYLPVSRQPNLDDGEPATAQTMQQWTAKQFGAGLEDDTAARIEKRKSVVADMQRNRTAPNTRISRVADDYRYPDRRAEAAG
jgi:hypothetical protein